MNTQPLRFIVLIVLSTLLIHSADAQYQCRTEPILEGRTTDFLPLEVGNKWTYKHDYGNIYFQDSGQVYRNTDPSSLQRVILRALLEIPGYPYFDDSFNTWPPESLTSVRKRFTIEITHTEKIGNSEYFVFSDVGYDWPPVPNFFLAGKKVRFSRVNDDEFNTLEFGENWGKYDRDLYRFHPYYIGPYSVPDQYLIKGQDARATLMVDRVLSYADDNVFIEAKPPTHWSQEIAAVFIIDAEGVYLGEVIFVTGYGFAVYNVERWNHLPYFVNFISPVSAVIDGKEIEFPYVAPEWTSVQPTSWGQLKAHHGQRP